MPPVRSCSASPRRAAPAARVPRSIRTAAASRTAPVLLSPGPGEPAQAGLVLPARRAPPAMPFPPRLGPAATASVDTVCRKLVAAIPLRPGAPAVLQTEAAATSHRGVDDEIG